MDLLEHGSDWLQRMRHRHATRRVTYLRGGSSVELHATIGRTVFEIRDANGTISSYESRDFLIRAEDLQIEDAVTLPADGDQIVETSGEQLLTFMVCAPKNEPFWRWSDRYQKTLRVHTKSVKRANL